MWAPNPCLSYQNPPFPRRCWEVPRFKEYPFCVSCLLLCSGRLLEMVDLWVSSGGAGTYSGLGLWPGFTVASRKVWLQRCRVQLFISFLDAVWSFEAGCIYMTAVEVAFQLGRVMGNWLVEKGKVEDWLIICIYIYTWLCIRVYIYIYLFTDFSKWWPPQKILRMLEELNGFGSVSEIETVKKCSLQNLSIMFLMFHSRWTNAENEKLAMPTHFLSVTLVSGGFFHLFSHFFWVWITMNRVATAPFKGRQKEPQILFEMVIS